MSPLFLKEFKLYNRAECCKKSPLSGYSLCAEHLVKARVEWQGFQDARRGMGKCCYCDNSNWKGMLRCKKHREINRARCKAWWDAKTPEFKLQKWKDRQAKWLALGKCPICYDHNDLEPGHRRCAGCRTYMKSFKRGKPAARFNGPVIVASDGARRRVKIRPLRPYSERW